jgi:hypothetical protein
MQIDLYQSDKRIQVVDAEGNIIEIPAPQPMVVGLPTLRVEENHLVIEFAFLEADGIRREKVKLTRKHTLNSGKVVEEPITELVVFPIAAEGFDRRVLFRKPYEAGSKPVCRSDDGVYPLPEYLGTLNASMEYVADGGVNIACATCPFSRWKRIDGRNTRDCDQQIQIPVAVWIDDKVFPVEVRFRSSAYKHGKRIADRVAYLKTQNVPPYNAGAELTVMSVSQVLDKPGLAGHVLVVKRIESSLFINLEEPLKSRVIALCNKYQSNQPETESDAETDSVY